MTYVIDKLMGCLIIGVWLFRAKKRQVREVEFYICPENNYLYILFDGETVFNDHSLSFDPIRAIYSIIFSDFIVRRNFYSFKKTKYRLDQLTEGTFDSFSFILNRMPTYKQIEVSFQCGCSFTNDAWCSEQDAIENCPVHSDKIQKKIVREVNAAGIKGNEYSLKTIYRKYDPAVWKRL